MPGYKGQGSKSLNFPRIQTKCPHQDGVVFACEKIVTSKLYEAGANRRITNIDTHVGMAAAGLVTDARQLAEIARSLFFS